MGIASGNGIYVLSKIGREYSLLEYVRTDGTQYVLTEWVPGANCYVELDIMRTDVSPWWEGSCGTYFDTFPHYDSAYRTFTLNDGDSDSTYMYPWNCYAYQHGGVVHSFSYADVKEGIRFTLGLGTATARIGEATTAIETRTASSGYPLVLFAYTGTGIPITYDRCNLRVYGVRCYNGGKLELDLVPAMHCGTVGLVDRISGRFYGNCNPSGNSFTAGPSTGTSIILPGHDESAEGYNLSHFGYGTHTKSGTTYPAVGGDLVLDLTKVDSTLCYRHSFDYASASTWEICFRFMKIGGKLYPQLIGDAGSFWKTPTIWFTNGTELNGGIPNGTDEWANRFTCDLGVCDGRYYTVKLMYLGGSTYGMDVLDSAGDELYSERKEFSTVSYRGTSQWMYNGNSDEHQFVGHVDLRHSYVRIDGKLAWGVDDSEPADELEIVKGWARIGNGSYPYVRIGDLEITCANLIEDIGEYQDAYDGRYYRATSILTDTLDGTEYVCTSAAKSVFGEWRLPSKADIMHMRTEISKVATRLGYTAPNLVRSPLYWSSSYRGVNRLGCNFTGIGYYTDSSLSQYGEAVSYLGTTIDESETTNFYMLNSSFGHDAIWYWSGWKKSQIWANIRLVRDVKREPEPEVPTITVGAHEYPIMQYGGRWWTLVNLHEESIAHGMVSDNTVAYPPEKWGYLYQSDSIFSSGNVHTDAISALLPDGWRVANESDFRAAVAADTMWTQSGHAGLGTITDLDMLPTGCYMPGQSNTGIGAGFNYWCASGKQAPVGYVQSSLWGYGGSVDKSYYFGVRLCKDA